MQTKINKIYDQNNVFARILRGELSCDKVFENQFSLAFYDRYPDAPIHILVIPKGNYIDWGHFHSLASEEEIKSINEAIIAVVEKFDLFAKGYRLVTNVGENGMQSVLHFHYHILGGQKLGGKKMTESGEHRVKE